ncbi:hypothetical protein BDZ91DRAFT_525351 [Kalaharituber pfeilii]|nr:hypothetical protein BDZ91DRAFT_525351 [Kalaharituber pfeilii]
MSVTSRQKDFWYSSDLASPASLMPNLVKEGRPRPSEWSEYPERIPRCVTDEVFKSLLKRLAEAPQIGRDDTDSDDSDVGICSESEAGVQAIDVESSSDEGEYPKAYNYLEVGKEEESDEEDEMRTPIKKKRKMVVQPQLSAPKCIHALEKVEKKSTRTSKYEWDKPGCEFDKSTSMLWGAESKLEGGEGLSAEDYAAIKMAADKEVAESQEIAKKIVPPNPDAIYLTDEAIQWAKTGIAGKIDMTIRLACQAYQQGNEALFLIEERHEEN